MAPKSRKSDIGKMNLPNNKNISYIPIPKTYTPKKLLQHHMVLRKRHGFKNPIQPRSYKTRAAEYLLLQHVTTNPAMFDFKGKKKSIDVFLKEDETTWGYSLSNEIGRLAQEIRDVKGNNAINFIPKNTIPRGKKVAYANMVCDLRQFEKGKI